jgi:hypothetical protein
MKLDTVNTFRLFGWLSVELMIKNSGYSELGYNEYLLIMNAFYQILRFFHSIQSTHPLVFDTFDTFLRKAVNNTQ